jgi:hypothetical protein
MKTLTRLLVPAVAASIALIAVSCGARAKQGYGSYETASSGPMAKRSTDMDYYSDMDGISDEAEYYAPMDPAPDAAGEYWADELGYSVAPASTGGGSGGGPGAKVEHELERITEKIAAEGVMAALELPPDLEGVKYAQAEEKGTAGGAKEPTGETKPKKAPDRLILYTAEMSLAVFRVEEKVEEIRKKIKDWGGYLVSMDSNRIVFRVPAELFEDALDDLSGMGDVTYKNIQGTDVTEEFRDLQIRLKNAVAVRDRLLELLSQTKTINESLQVEHELERITEKIELMKGRLKYLSEAALYSKITVHLAVKKKAKKPIPPLYAPFKWIQDVGLDSLFNF